MLRKILFFIFIFYILILFQTAFLVHFKILGIIPNFILIIVIFINILNVSWQDKISSAVIGGLYLDIFSLSNTMGFFGFWILTLLGLYFLMKIILKKYVRFSITAKV